MTIFMRIWTQIHHGNLIEWAIILYSQRPSNLTSLVIFFVKNCDKRMKMMFFEISLSVRNFQKWINHDLRVNFISSTNYRNAIWNIKLWCAVSRCKCLIQRTTKNNLLFVVERNCGTRKYVRAVLTIRSISFIWFIYFIYLILDSGRFFPFIRPFDSPTLMYVCSYKVILSYHKSYYSRKVPKRCWTEKNRRKWKMWEDAKNC